MTEAEERGVWLMGYETTTFIPRGGLDELALCERRRRQLVLENRAKKQFHQLGKV